MQRTDTPQLTTDAPQATPSAAQSPFGPERKREREEQPPVTIPGQRKASDLSPRPPLPAAPDRTAPLSHDISYDRFTYAAHRAFGEGVSGSAA